MNTKTGTPREMRSVITINAPTELIKKVYAYANKYNMSLSQVGILALEKFFRVPKKRKLQ